MTQIIVERQMDHQIDRVWRALADLSSHVEWMKDAVALEFATDSRTGVGTTMNVDTQVGPFRTLDVIEVTGWEDGKHIDVEHRGLVSGQGRLAAASDGDGTLVVWSEDLSFPWWLGGPITAWVARPILRRLWEGNLRRLEDTLTT